MLYEFNYIGYILFRFVFKSHVLEDSYDIFRLELQEDGIQAPQKHYSAHFFFFFGMTATNREIPLI